MRRGDSPWTYAGELGWAANDEAPASRDQINFLPNPANNI